MLMLMMMLVSSLTLGSVLRAAQAGSPWGITDNDYYYDSLNPSHTLPVITSEPQHITVDQGTDVLMPCTVNNMGDYSLGWRRGGQILWILQEKPEGSLQQAVTKDPRITLNGTALSVTNTRDGDGGLYTCELYTATPRTLNHSLVIRVPPTVYPANNRSIVTVKTGSSVTLSCLAYGHPRPSIQWSVKGRELSLPVSRDRLLVYKARAEDNGVYTCTADNGAPTTATATITLLVMFAPRVEAEAQEVLTGVGYSASLACYVHSEPRARVDWFKMGHVPVNPLRLVKTVNARGRHSLQFSPVTLDDLGVYTCNATNYMGNGSARLELSGRPGPVRYFNSRQGDASTSFVLLWDVESYAPVLSYIVSYGNVTDAAESWVNLTLPGTTSSSSLHTSSYTIENLRPGATYNLQVTAVNEFGSGDVTDTFQFTILKEDSLVTPTTTTTTTTTITTTTTTTTTNNNNNNTATTAKQTHQPATSHHQDTESSRSEFDAQPTQVTPTHHPPTQGTQGYKPSPNTSDGEAKDSSGGGGGTEEEQQQQQQGTTTTTTTTSSSSSSSSSSASATPSLTTEERTAMTSLLTAIILSFFFL